MGGEASRQNGKLGGRPIKNPLAWWELRYQVEGSSDPAEYGYCFVEAGASEQWAKQIATFGQFAILQANLIGKVHFVRVPEDPTKKLEFGTGSLLAAMNRPVVIRKPNRNVKVFEPVVGLEPIIVQPLAEIQDEPATVLESQPTA